MGKGVIAHNEQLLLFPQCFLQELHYKSFENTVGKGEIAHNEQLLLFPQCFLQVLRTFSHFHQIWNYHLQILSVWKSEICLLGKGKVFLWSVNSSSDNNISVSSIMKTFEDDNFSVAQMMQFFLVKVVNSLRKGENAGYHQFFLSRNVFKSKFLPGSLRDIHLKKTLL